MTGDVFFSTIADLNGRLKKREFSAVELVKAFAERLEKTGPRFNALALPLTQLALRRAKDVDAELKRGRFRGPLQGIPYGAKDLLAFAGRPTTWGSSLFAAQVFDESAAVITKLDGIGSVLIGKLSMVELAGGGGYRLAGASKFGPGLNPWDVTRWSGGSSSGPGSAVAAGLVPFALGSETSGSIVTPSAYCGVTGLRPTYGLVSRGGAMPLSWTMDKIGPLCRSAEDCGLVLQAIAGGDSKDPGSAGKSFYYSPEYARKADQIKIGFAAADMGWAEAEIRPVLEAAMRVLRETGATLMEKKLPELPWGAIAQTVITTEAASVFETYIENGKIDQLADASQAAGLKAGLTIPAKDYLKAMRLRSVAQMEFRKIFSEVDMLVSPARMEVAPKVSEPLDSIGTTPSPIPAEPGFRSIIAAGNLAGLPALVLPCGFAGGMPVALQLVGPAFSENTLLAVGREFQMRTDWHKRHPAVDA